MTTQTMNLDDRLAATVLHENFAAFIAQCMHTLAPGRLYLQNWHILALCYALERVRRGEVKRLIINMPPRSLKSIVASVAFPAFVLGHDSTRRFIAVSYAAELAVKHSADFRSIITAPWYQQVFPDLTVSKSKDTEAEIRTSRHGFRLASSVGGAITGRGGDFIVIDDPLKPDSALSAEGCDRVNSWYRNTLYSRLDDKVNGAIIVVMQRLHVNDLTGYLLQTGEDWEVLNLPAIADQEQHIALGPDQYKIRRAGELLHAEREPIEVLNAVKQQLGSHAFEAQYQQRPLPPDGAMIKRQWIQRFDTAPTLSDEPRILQSWDTANKDGAASDYSVCTTWLVDRGKYYLLWVTRERYDYPKLRAAAMRLAAEYKPEIILVEDVGVGTALISELRNAGHSVVEVRPRRDKVSRMSIQSSKFEAGRVYFPQHAPWLTDLETELFSFPNSRNDDQVDSISQALDHDLPGYEWTDEHLNNYQRLLTTFR